MDKIFILLSFIVFFVLIFSFAKYAPCQIIKRRARKNNIDISIKDANELIKMRCVDTTFFILSSSIIKLDPTIRITEIGLYYISGGNINDLLGGLLYAKKHQIAISYNEISSICLAGKDIIETLKQGKPYF